VLIDATLWIVLRNTLEKPGARFIALAVVTAANTLTRRALMNPTGAAWF
jgi:hypothetical protein